MIPDRLRIAAILLQGAALRDVSDDMTAAAVDRAFKLADMLLQKNEWRHGAQIIDATLQPDSPVGTDPQ